MGGIYAGQLVKGYELRGLTKRVPWGDKWHSIAVALANVGTGAAVCWDGRNYIYLVNGNNTLTFYRYDINLNTWLAMTSIPAGWNVKEDSSMCWDGGNYIYIRKPLRPTYSFYRYDITANSWAVLNSETTYNDAYRADDATYYGVPVSLAYDGSNYIYGLMGEAGSIESFPELKYCYLSINRYSISGDVWTPRVGPPGEVAWVFSDITDAAAITAFTNGIGSSMVYDGSDNLYCSVGYNSTTFIKYNISGNTRTTLATIPAGIYYGSKLIYDNGDFIYCIRGNSTDTVYRYSIKNNTWETMAGVTPAAIGIGGCGCYVQGQHIYYLRGGVGTTFYRNTI